MALACKPDVLIADEPTTALDVTIQAQILALLRKLQRELGMSILLITHDLGVVAEMADRVAVMYAGEIVEQADTGTLFRDPRHPYTKGLIGSIPVVGEIREQLAVIPGNVPNLIDLPPACRFAPRCVSRVAESVEDATEIHPALLTVGKGHDVRCWLYHDREGRVIRTEAPRSFRPGAGSIAGSVAVDERGDLAELGGTGDASGDADSGPASQ
jgi:oligopeptide/dipeptide ABC transporter ATP-binding protein